MPCETVLHTPFVDLLVQITLYIISTQRQRQGEGSNKVNARGGKHFGGDYPQRGHWERKARLLDTASLSLSLLHNKEYGWLTLN